MAAVLGMTDMFVVADEIARRGPAKQGPALRVSHWRGDEATTPKRVAGADSGHPVAPTVLLLPPALGYPVSRTAAVALTEWLKESHRAGTVVGSVCAGAFLLGETGLLAGRPATTHWAYQETFRERFPEVRLDADRLLVDDGDILTAGGVMAWTDLCLRLIDRFLGAAVMIHTARSFLVDPPGREQRFYSDFAPRQDHGDAAVLKVQRWLYRTGARQTRLAQLAEEAGLEERTLLRRFRKATGFTTMEYIQRLRVAKAQDLLRTGRDPIDRIAWEVGYSDSSSFRKVFDRIVGLTPGDYRQRFRGRP